MTPLNHLDDELLSALVDGELSPDETALVQTHIVSCAECQERLDGFRAVAALVRRLPEVDPPRDFALGPRLLVDPPNVVRLRRWYVAARVAAGSLAAVFVLLSAGTLYIDSRPASSAPVAELARPQVLSAPGDANLSTAAPAAAQRAAVPQPSPAAPALAPAAGAAAARPASAPQQPDDQVAATTSIRPLPTLPPTPLPTAAPAITAPLRQVVPAEDPAAPLRSSAVVAGLLAALSLLATVVVRHRLRHQTPHP